MITMRVARLRQNAKSHLIIGAAIVLIVFVAFITIGHGGKRYRRRSINLREDGDEVFTLSSGKSSAASSSTTTESKSSTTTAASAKTVKENATELPNEFLKLQFNEPKISLDNDLPEERPDEPIVLKTPQKTISPPIAKLIPNRTSELGIFSDFPQLKDCRGMGGGEGHLTLLDWPCFPEMANSAIWPAQLKFSKGSHVIDLLLTIHRSDQSERDFLKTQLAEQKRRIERVAAICLRRPELEGRRFLTLVWAIQKKPKVVFCPAAKLASTTWIKYLIHLAPLESKEEVIGEAREPAESLQLLYPPPYGNVMKRHAFVESLRFIVIQHPFVRFVTFYKSDIEYPEPKPYKNYLQKMQKSIIEKYRKPEETTGPVPTFSEFVDFFIDFTKDLKTMGDWQSLMINWLPYWVECAICASDYHIIVKTETLENDKRFLFTLIEYDGLGFANDWARLKKESSFELTQDYFKQLTKSQMLLLYQRLQVDFDLFEYGIEEYLKLAKEPV